MGHLRKTFWPTLARKKVPMLWPLGAKPPHRKLQCESKKYPRKLLRYFLSWWTCVIENYHGYCPNIFLCLHQFWSIYLNICVKCIIYTGETPQILRIQFSLLRNSWIFHKNTSHIKWHLIKYNSWYLLYEWSHYMFKIFTVGWHTCWRSIAVVFHSIVNGFSPATQDKSTKVHL